MSDHEVVPSHPDQVEELPLLISPAALESQWIAVLESHFQDILQGLWACNREGHGHCYYKPGHDKHVPINKDVLDSWVQKIIICAVLNNTLKLGKITYLSHQIKFVFIVKKLSS
ncbi:hypothetical protein BU17DRAFT_72400 [Hysterangium stoloniferum]|nr:hypothetical protein BU17DRAFT_72400 [Hysterangium stoloniferum]